MEKNMTCSIIKLQTIRCNCYVIQFGNNNVLIDTSMRFERKKIITELRRNRISHLSAIFITHNHSDHIANAAWLSEHFQCNIYISEISMKDVKRGICNFPAPQTSFSRFVHFLSCSIRPLYDFCKYSPCVNVIPLTQDVVQSFLGEQAYCISTMGHTKDSISIILSEIAIVGDAMVNRFGKVFPPFADVPSEISKSWQLLLDTGARIFLPSHGKEVSAMLLTKNLKRL